ncbi:MAG: rRNA maturation RNase YbeY [Bacteroidales bacterium]|nr:MAG: rRNA maturation RNase YbeY [Bacteroidales bacterium]
MAIRFTNQDVKFTLKHKRKVVSWIKQIAENNNKVVGDISVIFVSDNYILSINNQYLNHNYFTDIITFDYSNKNIIEGDIFISIDTVESNSKTFSTCFSDELLRVIAHGVLHLIGFNDKIKNEKKEMREQENTALKLFYSENDQ